MKADRNYKPQIFLGDIPGNLINYSNWLKGCVILPMSLQGLQDNRNWFINHVGYSNYFWYSFYILQNGFHFSTA